MLISNSCENMMYTKFPSFFVFPTSLIQILSFLFDSTYTVLHYGSSFAHAQTANPNFKLKKKTRISSKYKSCAVFAILFCNKPQGSMKSWQIKNHSNVAGWPWLFGLVVRRQPGHLILNSNKYPHSLVPCTYHRVLKRVKTGSFATSTHGKQKFRKPATFVLPF